MAVRDERTQGPDSMTVQVGDSVPSQRHSEVVAEPVVGTEPRDRSGGATAVGRLAAEPRTVWSERLRRGAAWTIVGSLVGSLILPAATKQWSDRSEELALKRDLIADVTQRTTDTVIAMQCIVNRCTPRAAVVDRDASASPEMRSEAQSELQGLLNETLHSWEASGAVYMALLRTYFPGSGLPTTWEAYVDVVASFIRIAGAECDHARADDMAALRSALTDVPQSTWNNLVEGLGPDCLLTPNAFRVAYDAVGDELLERSFGFTDAILRANAAGYSSGWGDFFDDLIPL